MKNILLLLLAILQVSLSYGQHEWHLSNTGIPEHYRCRGLTTAPNGDLFATGYEYYDTTPVAYNKLFRSTNGGSTWFEVMHNMPSWFYPTTLTFSDSVMILIGWNGTQDMVYSSTDYGANWFADSSGTFSNYQLLDVTVATNGDVVMIAVKNSTYITDCFFRSTDHGHTWTKVNTSGLGYRLVRSISYADDKMIAVTTPYSPPASNTAQIFTSTDDGFTWDQTLLNTPDDHPIYDLVFTQNKDIFFVGDYDAGLTNKAAIYMSSDKCGSDFHQLTPITGVADDLYYSSLTIRGNTVFLGGSDKIYVSQLSPISVSDADIVSTSKVFPSVFHDEINISISGTDDQVVTLSNNLGQTIRRLTLTPGATTLNANELATGFYFLTVTGNNRRETFRLLKQ